MHLGYGGMTEDETMKRCAGKGWVAVGIGLLTAGAVVGTSPAATANAANAAVTANAAGPEGATNAALARVTTPVIFAAVTTAAAQQQGGASGQMSPDRTDEEHQRRLMQRYERMVQFNLGGAAAVRTGELDTQMAMIGHRSLGERIAHWADFFWRRGDARYVYGRDPGGYVTEGRLVSDFATDCVLFFYRVTELGRSTSALEAVQFAFGTRFHAGSLEEIVDEQGRVDYDNPVHLDYMIDVVRSGIWGHDITAQMGSVESDTVGTSRVEPGSVFYLPSAASDPSKLANGDILFLVTDETTEAGRRVRSGGAIIGHVGIVRVEDGQTFMIHPAARDLEGVYEGGKVVKVPLATYLDRVETFKGVIVTRIESF